MERRISNSQQGSANAAMRQLAIAQEIVRSSHLTNEDNIDAYTIPEFCRRHRFSQAKYFIDAKKGLMPRVMRVGARVLISKEAAAEWRREREAAAAAEPVAA